MELMTSTRFEPRKTVTPEEAVTYVCQREAQRYDDKAGALELSQARHDALENIVGRLIGALIDNGALRAEQVSAIFDHDVSAEG